MKPLIKVPRWMEDRIIDSFCAPFEVDLPGGWKMLTAFPDVITRENMDGSLSYRIRWNSTKRWRPVIGMCGAVDWRAD